MLSSTLKPKPDAPAIEPKYLLIYATSQKSTIHHKNLARNKVGSLASQEDRRPNQFLYLAEPIHRRPHPQFFPAFALIQ